MLVELHWDRNRFWMQLLFNVVVHTDLQNMIEIAWSRSVSQPVQNMESFCSLSLNCGLSISRNTKETGHKRNSTHPHRCLELHIAYSSSHLLQVAPAGTPVVGKFVNGLSSKDQQIDLDRIQCTFHRGPHELVTPVSLLLHEFYSLVSQIKNVFPCIFCAA